MRAATIALMAVLISPAANAQADLGADEFALTGLLLPPDVPNGAPPNTDGSPALTFWLAIKNRTALPFSLRTAATGLSFRAGGLGVGIDHSPYWIVLPGETYFQIIGGAFPKNFDGLVGASVTLEGKPLAAPGNPQHWTL